MIGCVHGMESVRPRDTSVAAIASSYPSLCAMERDDRLLSAVLLSSVGARDRRSHLSESMVLPSTANIVRATQFIDKVSIAHRTLITLLAMDSAPSPQTVMDFIPFSGSGGRDRPDLLFVPAWATAISAAILLLHWGPTTKPVNDLLVRIGFLDKQSGTVPPPGIGKGAILTFRVIRLLGCLTLLALSISSSLYTREDWGDAVILNAPYLYASVLSALSVRPQETRHGLIRHVNCVLFLTFCVYIYRDILPLATFTGIPADLNEGRKLWAKITVLCITAVIVPLFTPRQYIPVDPLNPMKVANPEQTASLSSFALYFFMDQIIFLAHRESRLQEDELYPLCDTDASNYLKNRSFKYLDRFSGKKSKRHIFFGLMRVFQRDVAVLTILLILRPFTTMAGPFAMNRLLQYIETQDHGATVRPWVWIALIFFGPLVGNVVFQFYAFINTRSLVRSEAILTQLVFAHSLRIRMKAETMATSATNSTPSPKPGPKKSGGSLLGKINNLVTVDMGNINGARDCGELIISVPLQLATGIWFIYSLLGWSVWVGVASIILLTPVPGYMTKLVKSVQKERMKRTDERVQSVSEAMNVLRMVKLFGWEDKMNVRIGDKRDEELVWLRKKRTLDMAAGLVNYLIPVITMTVTYATYVGFFLTLIMGQPLNASKVFSSMTVFDLLRDCISRITFRLNDLITGKVSLDRLADFLEKTELLDAFDEKDAPVVSSANASTDNQIGFRNATFSWSADFHESPTAAQRQFLLKFDGELIFKRGRINLVVGPTGSGKTSLLMALLGEMHWIPSSADSWYNLPRESGVAYAAQESWVLNETIRSNIVFDTPFDEERYQKVLYQCALKPDMGLFQAGDQSEVGEKGLTLSGGQKARLTLARAVYSKASILLLDDILAALDVHTAQWIVEKCLGGDLMENRTVILVTHNVALARPIADFVVMFGPDGRVTSQGTISEVTKRAPLAARIRDEQQTTDKIQEDIGIKDAVNPANGKLIVAEEIQLGHVRAAAFKMYFLAVGGKHPLFFFTVFLGGLLSQQFFVVMMTWMLGYWAKQYEQRPAGEVNVVFFLSIFVAIVSLSTATYAAIFIFLVLGQLRASKVIHIDLINSVLTAPLRWLDVTPASRILARVTNDVKAVDDSLANQFWPLATMVVSMMLKFIAVVIYAPIFFFPGALVGALGVWIGQIYISGQLPIKRLVSNTRAPVLAHVGSALAGLVSIRAFGAESKFSGEVSARIDRYTRTARNYWNLNRWLNVRMEVLGSMFSASLATYLVYIKHTDAGNSGFLLNMAITFTYLLLWVVRRINDFEIQGNSLERIHGYIHIEHEKAATDAGKPPAYWPASGDLRVEGLSARYSEEGPRVLHDISFHIKSGERVGIVGRTGSGKSSLTLSLLRCIPTEGSVIYDGLETSELNLDALRSSVTIIPQVPELLSGTLRANLDPFGQYDDAELNDALRAAGLFALQDEMDVGRITLDSAISTGGSNLSIGQRQIFALARAILRRSKVLILDEATSAIDYKTDSIIQNSLRNQLRGDVSVITVAHRLQTIMDADKIMVLDTGRIVEFDSPKKLLKIKDGKFRALVEESGDREALYSMANAE
ncbi:P-loop containing nucleoside triphosphate hydrolase protein [Mycena polygramma]|nr:P-loop containing nucleoside triphosphate hydrolase protein [Mycena polygramma]